MSEPAGHHDEEVLGKAYDARLMRRLLGYIRPYKGMTATALVLILASSLFQLAGPLITAVTLDLFIRPQGSESQISAPSVFIRSQLLARGIDPAQIAVPGLTVMSLIFLATLILTFVALYAQGYVLQLMGQYIMNDLRRQIFGHLQRLPLAFYDRNPIGRLVTRVTTDVDALNEMFTAGIVTIFGDVMVLAGIAAILFWLDWRLALVSFSIVPLLLLLTSWFKAKVRESFREVRVKIARINAFLQEHITGMPVVQLFNREARAYAEFEEINAAHRDANVRSIFYYAVFFPGVELITSLGGGLLIWVGGGRVLVSALSIGGLIAFLQYAQRFYQPLSDLSEKYNILQSAMASSERIFRLLDTEATIATPPAAYRPERVRGDIDFDDVWFSYKEDEPVLKGLSFRVRPGETLAVVGHTGAGKSTLANLLLRFYDVDRGAVRVDGVDVREWDLARLRRSVAMVLQDVFLFSGSVGANIRLGEESIDDERVRWAAGEVHALPFIERLPGGFDTAVRERGAGLSVGQKQLIAFARALAFDPSILILDEATSSIDTETEQLIQRALDRLLVGRTSVVIAHRLSTIQKADRILVLHKGEVREYGTHQELLALRGIYYRLYLLQYKDQEGAEVRAAVG
ncbi:MAG TPA: ABC transporter ATP-binding protein [Thermoanaerobaculia bacterium]|jgi:ATP-binding cassette subfamily B protein|nr:ABC transporter ATP-binding protein [Thermoanaerobaculia bacterium]